MQIASVMKQLQFRVCNTVAVKWTLKTQKRKKMIFKYEKEWDKTKTTQNCTCSCRCNKQDATQPETGS